jgi:hypothetical protein
MLMTLPSIAARTDLEARALGSGRRLLRVAFCFAAIFIPLKDRSQVASLVELIGILLIDFYRSFEHHDRADTGQIA